MSYKEKVDIWPYSHEICVIGSSLMKYKDKIKGVREWFLDEEIDRSIGYDYIVKKEEEGFSFYLGYGVDDLKDKYHWSVKYIPADEEIALSRTIEILCDGLDSAISSWENFPKESVFLLFEYTGLDALNEWFDRYADLLKQNPEFGCAVKIESEDQDSIEYEFAESQGWVSDDIDEDDIEEKEEIDEDDDDMCNYNDNEDLYPLMPKNFSFVTASYDFDHEKNKDIVCVWIDKRLED